MLSRLWQLFTPTVKSEGKKTAKHKGKREYCPECGGQLVTPMPNGQKDRTGIRTHLDNASVRCPDKPKYTELCGFPVGPPRHGGYSRSCKLPARHAPASACSLYPLPISRVSCVHCKQVFTLVSVLICTPSGNGLVWDNPQMPVHDLPEIKYTPPKKRWWQRPPKTALHSNLNRRCPGA